jgi:hypothetical protein
MAGSAATEESFPSAEVSVRRKSPMFAATIRRLMNPGLGDATVTYAPFGRAAGVPLPTRPFARFRRDLRVWLAPVWPASATTTTGRVFERAPALDAARDDFIFAIDDLAGARVARLEHAIDHAVSLRDLWYLRTEVYSVVSGEFGQNEADQRLALLNRHFPTRSPKSGFGAFDATPRG